MAGVKGQKSGGYGGRKALPPEIKRSKNLSFRVSEEEIEIINKARGNRTLREFVVEKAKKEIEK